MRVAELRPSGSEPILCRGLAHVNLSYPSAMVVDVHLSNQRNRTSPEKSRISEDLAKNEPEQAVASE
jgi:hypothetical protein